MEAQEPSHLDQGRRYEQKFFHKFASHRRNVNIIWSLDDNKGDIQRSLTRMKDVAKGFFEGVTYDKPLGEDLMAHLHSLEHMPQFFTRGGNEELWKAVTKEELEKVLHSMPKDKSLGQMDGPRSSSLPSLIWWETIYLG